MRWFHRPPPWGTPGRSSSSDDCKGVLPSMQMRGAPALPVPLHEPPVRVVTCRGNRRARVTAGRGGRTGPVHRPLVRRKRASGRWWIACTLRWWCRVHTCRRLHASCRSPRTCVTIARVPSLAGRATTNRRATQPPARGAGVTTSRGAPRCDAPGPCRVRRRSGTGRSADASSGRARAADVAHLLQPCVIGISALAAPLRRQLTRGPSDGGLRERGGPGHLSPLADACTRPQPHRRRRRRRRRRRGLVDRVDDAAESEPSPLRDAVGVHAGEAVGAVVVAFALRPGQRIGRRRRRRRLR